MNAAAAFAAFSADAWLIDLGLISLLEFDDDDNDDDVDEVGDVVDDDEFEDDVTKSEFELATIDLFNEFDGDKEFWVWFW